MTVLEPVWVYGEREFHTGFYEYIQSAQNGMFAAPGSRKNKFHVIYARDLAKAYYLAYEKRLPGVNRLLLGNPEPEWMDKIMSLFCEEAGIRKPINLPKWLVYPIGFIMELLYTALGTQNPPLLTRGRVNMFYDNIEYSTKKAKKMLGFKCNYTLEQGIKKTVAWYRENNFI